MASHAPHMRLNGNQFSFLSLWLVGWLVGCCYWVFVVVVGLLLLLLSPLAPKVFSTGRDDKVVERSLIKQCHLEAAAPNDSSPGPWWVAAETVI